MGDTILDRIKDNIKGNSDNFHEVLACVSNKERSRQMPRVVDGSELSLKIRNLKLGSGWPTPELRHQRLGGD